jgi:hypothetical protein
MCSFTKSTPKPQPTPTYVPPYVAPAAAAPAPTPAPVAPPPPPVPDAPTPYYDQQAFEKAQASETQANALSRAKIGRAALKIDLVNNTGSTSTSGVNTTN